jgi:hypothetical protein
LCWGGGSPLLCPRWFRGPYTWKLPPPPWGVREIFPLSKFGVNGATRW